MAIKLIIQNAKAVVKTVNDYILNVTGIKDNRIGSGTFSNGKIDWTLQHLTDTANNFTTNNPILLIGQVGIETNDLATAPKFKIGNGSTAWNSLPYVTSGSGGSQTLAQILSSGSIMLNSQSIKSEDLTNTLSVNDTAIQFVTDSLTKNGIELATADDLKSVYATARNNTGSTILKGQVVYLTGAIGQTPTIALAQANTESSSFDLGVASFDIPNNTNVLNNVTILGSIENINTSALTEGAPVYLSASSAGSVTSTIPSSPNFVQPVGFVAYSHAVNGKLIIRTEIPLGANTTISTSNRIAVTSNALKTNLDLKSNVASPTFTGIVTTPSIIVSSESANRVAIIDSSKNIKSADTTTYPSLAELAFVKGVTSDIQTQLNTKGVGTIQGTASVTNGIAYQNGTSNTITTASNFTFNGTKVTLGSGTPSVDVRFNIVENLAGSGATLGLSVTNLNTQGISSINFGESGSRRVGISRIGSAFSSTITGTSLNYQNSTAIFSISTAAAGDGTIYIQGSPIIGIVGTTGTNIGTRNDSGGFVIGANNVLHTAATSTLDLKGSLSLNLVSVSSTYTALATDHTINCTSGTFTVTLPTAVGVAGRTYIVKNSGVGTITIATTSSQTIDGVTTRTLSVQYTGVRVQSNGSNWIVIGSF